MSGLLESGRWRVLAGDAAAERAVGEACGVTPLAARVMVARGIRDADSARTFLTPSLGRDWHDPLELPGLPAAADRVQRTIDGHEVIAVFGDFDVDGMSSACLLTLALRELGAEVHPYIPRRFGEGYGLSAEALQRVVEGCHPSLIVTVDNGIAAAREVELVRASGIDVVVTDHHEPADLVPEGVPVCDPKLDHACPSCDLAGAGVALKLVHELGRRAGRPDLWRSYTDVATLGTISDMMELTRENRSLVADGIERMRHTSRPGLVALAAVANCDLAAIEADSLPFSLVPRLNAAGRMGDVDVAFELLLTDDPQRAASLASELETINQNRRDIERELADQAFAMIEETYDGGRAIVVGGEGWHEGVKGIVASRVVNRYHVPTILFSISDGVAHGSGRSVGSVNLFEAVERCADLLVRFGGHAGAVGVTIDAENIDAFRARLESVLADLPAEQFVDTGEVAAVVRLSELDVPTIESLQVLRPFGQGNKVPLLAATGVVMRNRGRVGRSGEHLRFLATDGVGSVPAIMFRTPDVERACDYEGAVDLVFEAVAETWQGRTKPKLMVRDIIYRTADEDVEAPAVIGELFGRVPQILSSDRRDDAAVAPEARGPLASLGQRALTRELVRRFIGDASLLPAQAAALEALGAGRSALAVMATGRGKSLIFHVHAAREAILRGRASVLVYPLRALVADQSFHIEGELASLGVATRVLTGETPAEERARTFAGLADGSVDVVLTTPEFLAIHSRDFAAGGRVGFVVIDEAHHAGRSRGGARSAYQDLPRVLDELGRPTCLAVTATAAGDVAREVCRLAGIAEGDVIVDDAVRANLAVDDEREIRDRDAALVALASTGEKCVCYVNSREQSVVLARALRKANPELGQRIAFYNAGLTRSERNRVEAAFRAGQLSCVISTSAFGEGVNLPDVRHVVLYHMPFGAIEFNQMSGRAGRDGRPATIHLMFGSRDARVNERILASYAPDRDALVCLWRALRSLAFGSGAGEAPVPVARTNAELLETCLGVTPGVELDERSVSAGIAIFRDLGFLDVEGYGSQRRIVMASRPERMELDRSIRYLEGVRSAEEFHAFRDWILRATSGELLDRINRPILPGFGRVVREKEGGGEL